MENAGPSQNSQLPFSSYPAKSTALLQQRVWLSPEFGDEYDIYADTVQHHGATLVTEMGGEGTFHMLPRFEGVRLCCLNYQRISFIWCCWLLVGG